MSSFPLVGRRVHSMQALQQLRLLAQKRMVFECEIQAPGYISQGFGLADGQPKVVGRSRCAIATFNSSSEMNDGAGNRAESMVRYEIVVPRGVAIKEDYRIAEPAFFPSWEREKAYGINAMVSAPSQETGKGPYFLCIGTGVSGTEPLPSSGQIGTVVNDGEVRWKLAGYSTLYEVDSLNDNESTSTEIALVCRKLD